MFAHEQEAGRKSVYKYVYIHMAVCHVSVSARIYGRLARAKPEGFTNTIV